MIDSDPQGRVLTAQMLASLGFRVALAEDPEEGLRLIAGDGRFHAVLADSDLPGGGRALAARVREIAPELRIVLTGAEPGAGGEDLEFLPRHFSSAQLAELLGTSS